MMTGQKDGERFSQKLVVLYNFNIHSISKIYQHLFRLTTYKVKKKLSKSQQT